MASDVTSDDVVHASASPQPISGRRCRAGDPPTGHARHPEVAPSRRVASPGVQRRHYSACASIASMSSSDRPKWWPISWTNTWAMTAPSASSWSLQ